MGSKRRTDCIPRRRGNTLGGWWRDRGVLVEFLLLVWLVEGWLYEAGGKAGLYSYGFGSVGTRVSLGEIGEFGCVWPPCVSGRYRSSKVMKKRYRWIWSRRGNLSAMWNRKSGMCSPKKIKHKILGRLNSMQRINSTFTKVVRYSIGWSCCV